MSQKDKYRRVTAIKRSVKSAIGDDLSYEFRSSQPYQAYTGLCGEAPHAYQDGELTDEIVKMLDEYAPKGHHAQAERAGIDNRASAPKCSNGSDK